MPTPSIFISYRRADTASIASRIRDHLSASFGPDVFLDVDTLYAGQNWLSTIENNIHHSNAVLALIGPHWLIVRDPNGAPRLQNPDDHVRRELELAYQHKRLIIPVLINNTTIPTPSQLPVSLRWLLKLQIQRLNDNNFQDGIFQLIRALTQHGLLPVPSSLPPGSYLPFPRNAAFTGRQSELLTLADNLLFSTLSAPKAIIKPTALSGSGGIGKTQLAVEFSYRYGQFYQGVHWLQADQPLDPQIALCGRSMTLSHWPETTPEQVALTLAAWQRKPHRLIILDNLVDPAVLANLPSEMRSCRLLITSRRIEFDPTLGVQSEILEILPRPDSISLLRKLTSRLEGIPDSALAPLAERLSDYPLALYLAGMYLNLRRTLTPQAYIQELDLPDQILDQLFLDEWIKTNPTHYERNVSSVFLLGWNQLDPADSTDAHARRSFCAAGYCFTNTPIPLVIFRHFLGKSSTDMDLDSVFNRLQSLGLVTPSDTGPILHPLLAEFARLQDNKIKQMQGATNLPSIAEAVSTLTLQANETGNPLEFYPLRPHAQAAVQFCLKPYPLKAASLLNNLGVHQTVVAEYSAARASLQQALALRKINLPEDDPYIAASLNNLGLLFVKTGDYTAARPYYEQALQINRKVLGEHHIETARSLNNLGGLLRARGDYAAARPYVEQALGIHREVLGEKHSDTALSFNNLGSLLEAMGDKKAARSYYEQAVSIRREILGERHLDTAQSLNNLGILLWGMGDHTAARSYLEQALVIHREILGENHPDTAVSLNNLGSLLQAIGSYGTARWYYEQALAIRREILGERHPTTAISLNNLGTLLFEMGDYTSARRYYEQALSIFESTLPPNHPYIQEIRRNITSLPRK